MLFSAPREGVTSKLPHPLISKTGIPEKPVIGLVIKTDNSGPMENAIQTLLEAIGRKCEDSPGQEWYITSPREVEGIYRKNFTQQ